MMKKSMSVLVLFVCLLSLVACSNKSVEEVVNGDTSNGSSVETTNYTMEFSGISTTVALKHNGEKMLTETIETVQPYEALGVTNKEEAKAMVAQQEEMQSYDGIKGLTHSVEYKDDELIQKVEINFEKADLSELTNMVGFNLPSDVTDSVNFSDMEQVLLNSKFEKEE